jgi:hypothetical protein
MRVALLAFVLGDSAPTYLASYSNRIPPDLPDLR